MSRSVRPLAERPPLCASVLIPTPRWLAAALLIPAALALFPASLDAMEPSVVVASDPAASVTTKTLGAHLAVLTSKEFGGRSGPAARLTAEYVARRFGELGLEPAFAGGKKKSYFQPIPLSVVPRPKPKKDP
ncbi:MAG TPA: hypothetical protein VGE52_08895, partial [Pirellulales bacterium]